MRTARTALALVLTAVLPAALAAQPAPPAPAAVPHEVPTTDTAFQTIRGYLEAARGADWERAADYLDLSELPEAERVAAAERAGAALREPPQPAGSR